MKSVTVYQYDAFSKHPGKGNPAGVVFNGDTLSGQEMQEIAREAAFNETAFPVQSDKADIKIRFFTPGHEMNLCGHGTMATIYSLKKKELISSNNLTIETKAGLLSVRIDSPDNEELCITMQQAPPQFKPFHGSVEKLATALGLTAEDINGELPIVYGSTGTWTLLVPISRLDAFKKMKPATDSFPSILEAMPKVSIHPFCLETYDPDAQMHARHFSSPFSGTVEDAVTGTASGAMGAYYATYINNRLEKTVSLVVEQGQEIGKDGRVMVRVTKSTDNIGIEITGNAVYVKHFPVMLG
ncbi:phenazine biosynthesis protein PhzF family [Evansella caseinilytica]|uniref:Phenazine biosynthesis protein PhzF family n=1 Tax=Evansella caseinilytica TaxID=1503961 RepID=A0A1H3PLC0_9BACI|nr:PhzF family phenazine biosynthesis isomerase [Evansella caseinilytica]SDZ01860.1 phenazine biosynthesis protein PhzF family [Evansella caseinilytica]